MAGVEVPRTAGLNDQRVGRPSIVRPKRGPGTSRTLQGTPVAPP